MILFKYLKQGIFFAFENSHHFPQNHVCFFPIKKIKKKKYTFLETTATLRNNDPYQNDT